MITKTTQKILSKKCWENLQPFLRRKESRQRIILYLIALGYSVGDLVNLTIGDLKSIIIHDDLNYSRDEVVIDMPDLEPAFTSLNGDKLKHNYYYRLIRYAGFNVAGKKMSQQMFRSWLNTNHNR